MLSDDLDALAATFESRAGDDEMALAPCAVRFYGRTLRDLARRAESMEACTVPAHARLTGDLPDGVISMAAFPHANATRRGIAPNPKNGGGAA